MLEKNKIDDGILESVNGGTAEEEDVLKERFETTWKNLGYDKKYTGTELEDVFTQWQNAGYKPDAATFLRTCKTL